nr:hypothetical protein [Chitinimonas koreensis]
MQAAALVVLLDARQFGRQAGGLGQPGQVGRIGRRGAAALELGQVAGEAGHVGAQRRQRLLEPLALAQHRVDRQRVDQRQRQHRAGRGEQAALARVALLPEFGKGARAGIMA